MNWQIPKQTFIYKILTLGKSLQLPISDSTIDIAHTKLWAYKDSAEAQFNLAQRYEKGEGVIQDYAKAYEWYKKAANQGLTSAQSVFDSLYNNSNSEKDAISGKCDQTAIDHISHTSAQYYLEVLRHDGTSMIDKKAAERYHKAANQGDAVAQFNLGVLYKKGEGVLQNNKKAAEWFRKSADQNNSHAQYNLGIMYKKGEGVDQDYTKAVEWLQKSAEQNNNHAQFNLGALYEKGEGVPEDDTKAAEWFQKSAEQNNSHAQYNLGIMYKKGEGVLQDYAKATEWLQKSAYQNNVHAQFNLGLMYEKGEGVLQDSIEAMKWYDIACNNGSHNGCEHRDRLSSIIKLSL